MKEKSEEPVEKNTSNQSNGIIFLLTAAALIVLATIALFPVVKDFYFNPPPLSGKSTELGQLGDFIGGTLNPIFGFATVCLLLWSVFIQRKELSLTRDELTKSAIALDKQVKLATNEYNRKQIDDSLSKLYSIVDELYNHQLLHPVQFEYSQGNILATSQITHLKDVTVFPAGQKSGASARIEIIRSTINLHEDVNLFDIHTLPKILAAIDMFLNTISLLLKELMLLTNIESIKTARIVEFQREVEKFRDIHVISNDRALTLLKIDL